MKRKEPPPEIVAVPFERVAAMVRKLTHDVRNGLTLMELQSAYVTDLLRNLEDSADAVAEVKRLRGMIEEQARALQRLSARFRVAPPNPVRYPAKSFVEDFRERLAKTLPDFAPEVAWTEDLRAEAISVDVEMIFGALGESFQNAARFQKPGERVAAHAEANAGRFQIELREQKSAVPSDPAAWGREPLVSTRHDGYGLGLFHARQLLAAHGGGLEIAHDAAAAQLTTRIFLPLAK